MTIPTLAARVEALLNDQNILSGPARILRDIRALGTTEGVYINPEHNEYGEEHAITEPQLRELLRIWWDGDDALRERYGDFEAYVQAAKDSNYEDAGDWLDDYERRAQ